MFLNYNSYTKTSKIRRGKQFLWDFRVFNVFYQHLSASFINVNEMRIRAYLNVCV